MAIYSLNVASIGKTTHAAGTAGAHLRYIARPEACSHLDGRYMPLEANAARSWMDAAEAQDRKNARVLDKLRVALPRELSQAQRAELLREFCDDITGGRTPYLAAIHQTGADAHNPHAHIVVRDRDIETGRRVLKWSDSARDRKKDGLPPNAVDHIRERWEILANRALERAGLDARIDRRSLEAQGVDREPTIHVGPRANQVDDMVQRPESKMVIDRRGGRDRPIDYPMIDAGRTRKERNAEIVDINLERAARSPDFATRARAQLAREQIARDRNLERTLVVEARRRTLEARRLRAEERAQEDKRRIARDAAFAKVDRMIKERFLVDSGQQRAAHQEEHAALTAEHARTENRLRQSLLKLRKMLGFGGVYATAAQERRELKRRQARERKNLTQRFSGARKALQRIVVDRHQTSMAELRMAFADRKADLAARNRAAEADADRLRQARAAERERAERELETQIRRFAELRQSRTRDRGRDRGLSL